MADDNITLTPQELEDLKDDIKFRTFVKITLKQLTSIPQRVDSLETHKAVHYFLLTVIIAGILWFKFM